MMTQKVKRSELLFFAAFGLYLFIQLLSSTLISAMIDLQGLRLFGFYTITVLLLCKFVFDNSLKQLWIYMLIIAVFLIVGLHAANIRDLLILALLTYEARNIRFFKVVNVSMIMIGACLILTVTLYWMGFFQRVDISNVRDQSGVIRQSLGFGWVTYSANYFLSYAICGIFLNKGRKHLFLFVFALGAVSIILFLLTNTRVAFYETILLLLLYILVEKRKLDLTRFFVVRLLLIFSFLICAVFSIWIAFNFDNGNPVMRMINEMMTYRLSLANTATKLYGINIWGNSIAWTLTPTATESYMYVDISYVQILIQYGLVVFIYVLLLFTLLMHRFVKDKNNIAIICLLMIALHSITDPQLFNLAYNPFLLALGLVLQRKRGIPQLPMVDNS